MTANKHLASRPETERSAAEINADHARAILVEIMRFFKAGWAVHPGSLLFADDWTLKSHIEAALKGLSEIDMRKGEPLPGEQR